MMALYLAAEWLASVVEMGLCFTLMHLFFADQFPARKMRRIFLLYAALTCTGTLLLNLSQIQLNLATSLYAILVFTLGGCILFRGRAVDLCIVTLCFLSGMNLLEGSLLRLANVLLSPDFVAHILSGFSLSRVGMLALFKGLDALAVFLVARLLARLRARFRPSATTTALLAACAGFIGSLYLEMSLLGQPAELFLRPQQAAVSVVLMALLFLAYLLYRLHLLKEEQRHTALQNRLLAMNYALAQESYATNAKLYHDMHGHLALLQQYLADGKIAEAQRYLATLSGNTALGGVTRYTGIDAIDYILSQKLAAARDQGIAVTVNAEYPRDCTIDPVDLCTILTNLLDNALRAAAASSARTLALSIRRFRQTILIQVVNSADQPPQRSGGRLRITKADSAHHGWGLASVQSACEKYSGTLDTRYADRHFTASVMLFYQ